MPFGDKGRHFGTPSPLAILIHTNMNVSGTVLLNTRHLMVVVKPFTKVFRFSDVNRSPFSRAVFLGKDVIARIISDIQWKFVDPVKVLPARLAGPADSLSFSLSHSQGFPFGKLAGLRGLRVKRAACQDSRTAFKQ